MQYETIAESDPQELLRRIADHESYGWIKAGNQVTLQAMVLPDDAPTSGDTMLDDAARKIVELMIENARLKRNASPAPASDTAQAVIDAAMEWYAAVGGSEEEKEAEAEVFNACALHRAAAMEAKQ